MTVAKLTQIFWKWWQGTLCKRFSLTFDQQFFDREQHGTNVDFKSISPMLKVRKVAPVDGETADDVRPARSWRLASFYIPCMYLGTKIWGATQFFCPTMAERSNNAATMFLDPWISQGSRYKYPSYYQGKTLLFTLFPDVVTAFDLWRVKDKPYLKDMDTDETSWSLKIPYFLPNHVVIFFNFFVHNNMLKTCSDINFSFW